jgi:molybdate transport system substrate-binding protein
VFNFAGSSTLARQIEEGAPADVYFSADEAQMNRLEQKGLLLQGLVAICFRTSWLSL